MINLDSIMQSRLVTGFVGSLIGLSVAKECDSWTKRIVFVLTGSAVSFYFAPWISHWFGATEPSATSAIGCGVGIAWQTIISKFIISVDGMNLPTFTKGGK